MQIKEFHQTVFVTKDDKVKCHISVLDWDGCNPYFLSARVNGEQVLNRQPNWNEEMDFYLPAVEEDSELVLELFPFQDTGVVKRCRYLPPKPWSVEFFLSSHEDLGYCAYVNTLASECAEYLDAAMELAERESGYSYVIEHFWWLKGYEQYRGDADRKRLKELMQKGRIELSALHCSNHTHWQGAEQLVRAMYYACGEGKDTWGITPRTVIYADIAGASWSCVSAYANAGIRYICLLGNRYLRFSIDDERLPQLFWWQAPNRKDRLLCFLQKGYKNFSISRAMGAVDSQIKGGAYFFDQSRMESTVYAIDDMIAGFGDVPYDKIPVSFYMDREYPNLDMKTVCDRMKETWKYPRMGISTPEKIFSYIEEKFGGSLPVLSGDITDQWADFAAISPEWFARKRKAQTFFPVAETFTLLQIMKKGGGMWPSARLDEALWKMCEFDDHCWATSSKHPQEMHKFNLNLVKRETAKTALALVEEIICEAVGSPGAKKISIWNPLPMPRYEALRLTEGMTPEGMILQCLEDGSILTQAVSLPACGYLNEFRLALKENEAARGEEVKAGVIETPYYRIHCNRDNKTIDSILDKSTGRELLDHTSGYALGECVYVHTESKDRPPFTIEFPKRRSLRVFSGPLAVEIVMEAFEEQIGANIRSAFTFYREEKTVDAHLSFENAVGLMGDYYDRYKKNLFFAFPFLVHSHYFCTELAGGIVNERKNRMPVNPHDFVMAHSWVSVENGQYGLGLFSREMPLFHLGGIHYNEISSRVDYENSSAVFLYAASNRANNLNYCTPADCHGEFHLSILPFEGTSEKVLPDWSYRKLFPPLVGGEQDEREKSFLSLKGSGLRLLCMKPDRKLQGGIFCRLYETQGNRVRGELTLPFEVQEAYFTNNLEEPTGKKPGWSGCAVDFVAEPFSYVNLLIKPCLEIDLEPEAEQEGIKNIFSFISENTKTIVCFEKGGKHNGRYAILDGEMEILRVEDEPYRIQRCTLPGINYGNLRVISLAEED